MNNKIILPGIFAALSLLGCRKPNPIDIAIPQSESKMVISSHVVNEHVIMVSAVYSIPSTARPTDVSSSQQMAKEMLIDSALVVINEAGQPPVPMSKLSSVLYTVTNVTLKPGTEYTLTVTDCKKNVTTTAKTTYTTTSSLINIATSMAGTANDSLVNMSISIDDVNTGDRYFVSYSTLSQLRQTAGSIKENITKADMASLVSFEPKRIQLLENTTTGQNKITGSFAIKASHNDTLLIQVARVDDDYYKYLVAYKRTGYFLNQLTGEPINLPSNIKTGHGYFALYQTRELVVDIATGKQISVTKAVDDLIKNWPNWHL
jgi:hypothetical protein